MPSPWTISRSATDTSAYYNGRPDLWAHLYITVWFMGTLSCSRRRWNAWVLVVRSRRYYRLCYLWMCLFCSYICWRLLIYPCMPLFACVYSSRMWHKQYVYHPSTPSYDGYLVWCYQRGFRCFARPSTDNTIGLWLCVPPLVCRHSFSSH